MGNYKKTRRTSRAGTRTCHGSLFVSENVASATADLARVVQFDIPAQTLGAALLRFSEQAQLQVIVESRLAESVSAPPLKGAYDARRCAETAPGGLRPHVSHGGQRRGCHPRLQAAGTQSDAVPGGDWSFSGSMPAGRIGGISSGAATSAVSEQSRPTSSTRAGNLGEIIVVGTRRLDRSAAEAPVPIDQIPVARLLPSSGRFDVGQLLQFSAPSFNSNRQVGADGADHIDSATLRGLGPTRRWCW
jgi:hypothetical protein